MVALCSVAALGLWAAPGVAQAQDADAESVKKIQEAERFYKIGLLHFEGDDYAKAAENFERAFELDPNAVLAFNVARAYENNADLEKAEAYYTKALELNPDESIRVRCESALVRLKRIRSSMVVKTDGFVLEVTSNIKGDVFINGEPIGATPQTYVSEGEDAIVVEVTRDGHVPFRQTVQGKDGERLTVVATLQESALLSWVGWSGLGVSAFGLGVALVGLPFASDARSAYDEAQELEAQRDSALFDDLREEGEQNKTYANALYIGGGVLMLGGLTMFALDAFVFEDEASSGSADAGPRFWVGPTQAGVALEW